MRRFLALLVPAALLLLSFSAVAVSQTLAAGPAPTPERKAVVSSEPAPERGGALRFSWTLVAPETFRIRDAALVSHSADRDNVSVRAIAAGHGASEFHTVNVTLRRIDTDSHEPAPFPPAWHVGSVSKPVNGASVRIYVATLQEPKPVLSPTPVKDSSAPDIMLVVVHPDGQVLVYVLGPNRDEPCALATTNVVSTCRESRRTERLRVQGLRAANAAASADWTLAWIVLLAAALLIGAGLGPLWAAGLFSRFDRNDILDHPRRAQVYEAVRAEPGITFGLLCDRLGLVSGVAQHHLSLLERHGVVRRIRDGRTTRYHAAGPRVDLAPIGAKARVLEAMGGGALTATELSERLGRRLQTTLEHLKRLEARGFVASTVDGRARRWHRVGSG